MAEGRSSRWRDKKRPRWRGICQIRQQMRKIQVLLKGGKETTEEKG